MNSVEGKAWLMIFSHLEALIDWSTAPIKKTQRRWKFAQVSKIQD